MRQPKTHGLGSGRGAARLPQGLGYRKVEGSPSNSCSCSFSWPRRVSGSTGAAPPPRSPTLPSPRLRSLLAALPGKEQNRAALADCEQPGPAPRGVAQRIRETLASAGPLDGKSVRGLVHTKRHHDHGNSQHGGLHVTQATFSSRQDFRWRLFDTVAAPMRDENVCMPQSLNLSSYGQPSSLRLEID